ncbi:MAG: metallophosphoesterase [Bacteroidota bacterium]
MKKYLLFLSSMLIAAQIVAQDTSEARIRIDASGAVNPWNHLDINKKEGSFQFAIVTDRTGGLRPGVFPEAIRKLNLLQPEFVMSVGDLITGYTEDEARIDEEWDEFTGFIDNLEAPFFYLPGNHDYINEVMARKWKERFGRDYYHFVYEDVLFLCLNSEEKMQGAGRGYIDEPQLAYIDEALAANPSVRWTLVFLHQPLWDQKNNGKWSEVEALLADRKHTVFAGHRHRYVRYERNQSDYFILATTGGGSGMRGPRFGEFDHVVWVTMTEEGPILANLLLDGIWDKDIQTEESYLATKEVLYQFPVQLEPLFVENGAFSGGEIHVKMTNDSDLPLEVNLSFNSSTDIWVATDGIQQAVGPNSVEQISIPLKTPSSILPSEIHPIRIHATATYKPADYPVMELEQSIWFAPQMTYDIRKAKKAPQIDGDLKEWKSLTFSDFSPIEESDPFSHSGQEDASFAFDIRQRKDWIYLAASVQDDQIESSDKVAPFDQDGLAFVLDPRSIDVSSMSTGYRNLFIAISPEEEGDGPGNIFRKDRLPDEIQSFCRRTETGYDIEIAIPISAITRHQGENWKHLRLNVIQFDKDKEGAHSSRLLWQSDWQGENHVMGSGTFVNH